MPIKRIIALSTLFLILSCSASSDTSVTTTPEISFLAQCGNGIGVWDKLERPSEFYINLLSPCMNNGVGDKIEVSNWTTWSVDVATGVGRFGVNTYIPYGGAENYDFYEITITLDSPIDGFFSKMHLSWTIAPPTALQSYEVQPMSSNEVLLSNGPEADCDNDLGWLYNDSLPIEYCNQGRGVQYIQSELGLAADGYFGRDTWIALGRFQLDNGLSEFGNVGPETWAKLFPYQEGLPGRDYNGDGLVTPDEFGE